MQHYPRPIEVMAALHRGYGESIRIGACQIALGIFFLLQMS
jgi:hypothetical protein